MAGSEADGTLMRGAYTLRFSNNGGNKMYIDVNVGGTILSGQIAILV